MHLFKIVNTSESPRSVQLVARIKTLVRAIFRASRCTLQYGSPLFDGARFLTRAFYINRLLAYAVKRAPSKALKIKES